ncbi:Hypothetical predicted protein [Mytilus galloprovincialis]|uniref:Uncharacterized protein n=1 Tax=Mytilus galloprovincialis TaxID=29158 RepID=A0A8B6FVZ9_MYTGA|nr:Hypothetical predicted protein [Mytilus galloprovincialis]
MAKENGPFNPEKYIDLIVFNIMIAVCFGESVELDDPDFMRFMKLRTEANEMIGKERALSKICSPSCIRYGQQISTELSVKR